MYYKNPIADPYILGISSGASAGAVAVIVFGGISLGIGSVAAGAFAGALLCGILVFIVGTQYGKSISTIRLILTGLAVSTIFSSITNIFLYSAKNAGQVKSAVFWTMGSLGRAKWGGLFLPFAVLVFVFIFSLMISKSLDILILGRRKCKNAGSEYRICKNFCNTFKHIFNFCSCISYRSNRIYRAYSSSYMQSFLRKRTQKLIIVSVLTGAVFLIWCDVLARVMFPPKEIPIGIITSIIGGPFLFIYDRKKQIFFRGGSK